MGGDGFGAPELVLGLIWIGLTVFVAWLAQGRGRDAGLYFFIGIVASPVVAAIFLIAAGENREVAGKRLAKAGKAKICPRCAEAVPVAAKICRCCGGSVAQVACPSCGTEAAYNSSEAGKATTCESCGHAFKFPRGS